MADGLIGLNMSVILEITIRIQYNITDGQYKNFQPG